MILNPVNDELTPDELLSRQQPPPDFQPGIQCWKAPTGALMVKGSHGHHAVGFAVKPEDLATDDAVDALIFCFEQMKRSLWARSQRKSH